MQTGSIEVGNDIQAGGVVVFLRGEHDLHTAHDVHEQLTATLGASDALIADLTSATFVDSSIVGVLLDIRQAAAGSSKRFAVCLGPDSSESVRRIFDITGLTESLPVLPNHDLAAQAAESPSGGD